MRPVRLAGIVAEAEFLRLRRMARRMAIDAALVAIAVIFLLAALALGHVALYLTIAPRFGSLMSVVYLLAGDVVLAVVFAGLVVVNGPGRIERQALEVRQTARQQLAESLTTGALIASAARAVGARQAVGLLRSIFELLGKHAK
jgi:uncharacterized membrane protein (DUF485 family)